MAKANVNMDLTGDEKNLVRAITRSEKKVDELQKKLKMMGKAGQKAGKETTGAFGTTAVNRLEKYALKVGSVTAAVGLAAAAIRDMRKAEEESATRITTATEARRAIFQISKTPEDAQFLLGQAERMRTQFGIGEVKALVDTFKAGSAGPQFVSDENIDVLASLTEIALNPSAALSAAVKLQKGFGGAGAGRAGAGTQRQVINKILAASGEAQVNAAEIADALSTASVSFAAIGGQDEALLAMGAIFSDVFKSPLAASERIKTISDQLRKKRPFITRAEGEELPQGLELIAALPGFAEAGRLRSEGGKELSLDLFLAEANALQAMSQFLQSQPEIRKRLADVVAAEAGTGGEGDLLTRRLAIARADPQSTAVRQRAEARETRELQEEGLFGTGKLLSNALADRLVIAFREQGQGEFQRYFREKSFEFERWLLGNEFVLREYGHVADRELGLQIDTHLLTPGAGGGNMDRAATKLEAAADKLAPTNAPPRTRTLAPVNVEPQ